MQSSAQSFPATGGLWPCSSKVGPDASLKCLGLSEGNGYIALSQEPHLWSNEKPETLAGTKGRPQLPHLVRSLGGLIQFARPGRPSRHPRQKVVVGQAPAHSSKGARRQEMSQKNRCLTRGCSVHELILECLYLLRTAQSVSVDNSS